MPDIKIHNINQIYERALELYKELSASNIITETRGTNTRDISAFVYKYSADACGTVKTSNNEKIYFEHIADLQGENGNFSFYPIDKIQISLPNEKNIYLISYCPDEKDKILFCIQDDNGNYLTDDCKLENIVKDINAALGINIEEKNNKIHFSTMNKTLDIRRKGLAKLLENNEEARYTLDAETVDAVIYNYLNEPDYSDEYLDILYNELPESDITYKEGFDMEKEEELE